MMCHCFLTCRSFLEEDVPDSDYHYAINVVDRPGVRLTIPSL